MNELKDILHKLGYTRLQDSGTVFRTKPLYRDSGNDTILCIFKNTGYFTDHGRDNIKGPLEELVKITLNLKTRKEAAQWLGKKYYDDKEEFEKAHIEYVEIDKIFDKENLSLVTPVYDYWNSRGISNETLRAFQSGIDNGIEGGKMQNRYVFPIFDQNFNIAGLSGRKLEKESKRPKWIHYGQKSKWIYPSFISEEHIKQSGEVILVESIGDMLSLWDAGVKNTIVLFGVNLSKTVLLYLIKLKIKKIIVALNNDGDNKAGNKGAKKILDTLEYYFTKGNSKIALPLKNDFNDMTKKEIKLWRQNV
jgi:5S rRNA maturation endonuclease (ribonuclease M5)